MNMKMGVSGSNGTLVVKLKKWWQKWIEIAHEYTEP
jgi:hypothetical protein